MSPFFNKRALSLLVALAFGGVLPSLPGQVLTRLETEFDGIDGVSGITGAFDVVVSPDGAHVYVVGSLPIGGGSIALFSRDDDDASATFGEVTFVEAYLDDGIDMATGIDGLRSARSVAVSPDGKHVYVAALSDNSVVVFSRNTTAGMDFGKLTHVETLKDGVMGVDGLAGAHGVIVSPDGEHVYVCSRADDAVAVFSRDDATGMLTFVEDHQEIDVGISGLADAERLTLSPDGKHLYVASEAQGAPGSVAVFSRNTAMGSGDFGKLTFVESLTDGLGGADGLANANDVAVSPDGNHVYVSNRTFLIDETADWIGIFTRNAITGALTFVSKLTMGDADLCDSLFQNGGIASEVVVSADGKSVIASNNFQGAVVVFSRDAASGALTLASMDCDEAGNEGTVTINAVAGSPGGEHVYTTGLGAPASLVVFSGIEITVEFQATGVEVPDGDATPTGVSDEGTDFGSLDPAGDSEIRTFEIRNDGITDLELTGPTPVTLTGPGAGEFGVTQPASLTLAPGEMTTFTVTFDPVTVGGHGPMVNIANNDPDENPYEFSILGIGVAGDPDITVEFQDTATGIADGDASPSALEGTDFGKLLAAGGNPTRTFEIRNDGVVNLNLTGADPVSLAGAAAAQFGFSQPGIGLLAPGESTTFTVTYAPPADGTHAATVNIASNDPDEALFDFQIVGINRAAQFASLRRSIDRLKKKVRKLQKRFRKSKSPSLKRKVAKQKKKLRKLMALRRSL